ncbi:MAG: AmpG family muropeptide MFS transporter [Pseudomonadota bacterium]
MTPENGSLWRQLTSPGMVIALLMGFSAGLPLLLTSSLLQAWMSDAGVDLGTIGLYGLVGLPYTLKFAWAPLVDRYGPRAFGRRRGWMLGAQLCLFVAIGALAFADPRSSLVLIAVLALAVTLFSATQDIVIDAYRRESLRDDGQAAGAALYVIGYRTAMLFASGGGLIMADQLGFEATYGIMASAMLVGIATTFFAAEPVASEAPPVSLAAAVVEPFRSFFARRDAWLILLFILLYKLGDTMASHLSTPFYLELGYSKTEIGSVVKALGFWATIIGGLLGGALWMRLGVYRALWLFGILQAVSTAGFVVLAQVGYDLAWLTGVIAFETLTGGMGTAAYMAFMALMTDRRFTATQYALLTSLMGFARVVLTSPTGFLAEGIGWTSYFTVCTLIAVPGLLLLFGFKSWLDDQQGQALPAR